jgi:hypothetical protein
MYLPSREYVVPIFIPIFKGSSQGLDTGLPDFPWYHKPKGKKSQNGNKNAEGP